MRLGFVLAAVLAAGSALGQEWEVGAIGGYGFSRDLTVKAAAGSANAGFANGGVIGAFGGNDMYNRWSGKARFLYRYSDLRLSSGGTKVGFSGNTQIFHGDFLWHSRSRESRIRPFIAFGAGMKVMRGTGIESAGQPLGRFAALTSTWEAVPVADVGGGVKVNLRSSVRLRAEVRDYISPPPEKVIAAVPGGSLDGWLNDIMALVAISYTW
jgi:hypothetical protein